MALLAEEWAGEMLRMLDREPSTAEELERRLGGRIGLSPRRGLRKLSQAGLVASLSGDGMPPRPRYVLDPRGRDLLDAIDALEAWRTTWTPMHSADVGLRRLVAQREARLVGRALVEEPLPFRELQRRVPGLSAGTLHRVLSGLRKPGIVSLDARSTRNHPLYELGEPARRLGRVTVLSARWRWRWAADHASIDVCDLPALVHLLAPLTKVPRQLEGVCQLAVEPPAIRASAVEPSAVAAPTVVAPTGESSAVEPSTVAPPAVKSSARWPERESLAVWVRIAGGHLSALALQPVLDVQTRMHASPLAWCDALLEGRRDGIEVAGDATLADAVVTALAEAVAQ